MMPPLAAATSTLGALEVGANGVNVSAVTASVAGAMSAADFTKLASFFTNAVFVLVTRTTAQSIPNNTLTNVNWTSETTDASAMHDNATNNDRLICPVGAAGVYVAGAWIGWDTAAAGTIRICDILHSSGVVVGRTRWITGGGYDAMSVVAAYPLAAGEYFTCRLYQNSGGALNLDVATQGQPYFWTVRIGT